MKILISSDQYPPAVGGVPTAVHSLVTFLSLRGHDIIVLTGGEKNSIEDNKNIRVYRFSNFPIPLPKNTPIVTPFTKRVREIFDKEDPDVVHLELLLGLGIDCFREAKKRNIPTVFTLHALPENVTQGMPKVWPISRGLEWFFWRWVGYFAERVDCITAPSDYAVKLLTSRFKVGLSQRISNGLDLKEFKRKYSQKEAQIKLGFKEKQIILYVGRLQKEKSPELLIEAASLVYNKHPQALFILVGTGPMFQDLKDLVEKQGLTDKMILPGFVNTEDLKSYYEAASVFVMPSAQELQGISVMEAMAYSLPIVACRARALPELVEDGKNGFLFEEGSGSSLANKLNSLLDSKSLEELGKNSYAKIQGHDIRKTALSYENLYFQIMKTKKGEDLQVSVVIPVYNEEKFIGQCLDSLTAQKSKPQEIIIVDNNCTDKTVAIAGKYPVTIIKERKQGIIAARNAGFNHVKNGVIARCDADTILPKDWVKKIQRSFKDQDIAALSGKVMFYDLAVVNRHSIYSRLFMKAVRLALKHETLVGPNMAIKKDIWEKVRDEVCLEDTEVHEDIDLSIHVAKYGRIMFDPKLLVYVSARRIKYNPSSFFVEYPIRLMKTIRIHRIPISTKFKTQIKKIFNYFKVKV